jgi:hypothetical protein|tara:strand:+ start:258 stop:368 length:111 start_codon:yes stop_codon:yes gene_type:complete
MMKYIEAIRFKIEVLCTDHPLALAFGAGFILGALIF